VLFCTSPAGRRYLRQSNAHVGITCDDRAVFAPETRGRQLQNTWPAARYALIGLAAGTTEGVKDSLWLLAGMVGYGCANTAFAGIAISVVIRRENALELLRAQLFTKHGKLRKPIPRDKRVVYTSTLVDAAGNMELLKETAAACNMLFEHTNLDVRILSKSPLLKKIADLVPEKHHQRLILGFSTGTLDDRMAAVIEKGAGLVSKRIEALHWLQDNGFRTFGMLCPSLPQDDYAQFSRELCDAIRVDRCEHVWAEVINVRGESFVKTLAALSQSGFHAEAERLSAVCGPKSAQRWENYARATFLAHTANVPAEKLRFLQYVKRKTADWWTTQAPAGAVLLGKAAQ